MSAAKITLIGFNNYLESLGDDLFKFLNVPAGIDKSTLVNNILLQGGEFEVLYSDPVFLQNMIGVWSQKWQRTMQKWVKALSITYNPLENYDRMEEWTDTNTRGEKTTRSESANGHDESSSSGSGNTENTRSAYNSSVYQPHDNAASSSTGSNISNSLTTASGTTDTNQNELLKKVGRAHGNIGVTTSQQMLESEIEISKFNIYEELTNLFLTEFCIYLY